MNLEYKTKLIGHNDVLKDLINLFNLNKLPNTILLSGKKGIGKSIIAFHFINYVFSKDEINKYDIENNIINLSNKSFKLVNNNTHPNFFIIDVKDEKKTIEVNQIREMINFSNKSSFNNAEKIILIDNVENLNKNSANALLKILEEPKNKTFFILIHDSQKRIIDTIKSRCIEFKIKLDHKYLSPIVDNYFNDDCFNYISDDFISNYATPSFYINFIEFCSSNNLDFKNIKIEEFLSIITSQSFNKSKKISNNEIKNFIELYFYKKLYLNKNKKVYDLISYFNKKFSDLESFNLDLESYFIEFRHKLLNE